MKTRTACLAGILVLTHTSAFAQTDVARSLDTPTVHAGLFRFYPDGRVGGSAAGTGSRTGDDLGGTVYVAPCGALGAAGPGRAISAAATDVWKITGTVLELSAEQASVQIGWQRVRKDGQDETSAPQTLMVTLKVGERTTLETISIPARGACGALYASLDVALVTTRAMLGGGGRVGASAGAKPTVYTGPAGGGAITIGRRSVNGITTPSNVRADLWLVRSTPGREDETLHASSQLLSLPLPFAFAPVTIRTPAGTLTVKVEGTVESGLTPTGEPRFYFSASRTTSFAPASRATRDTAPVTEGSTKTTVAMPGPDDVLSFELPPLRTPDGAAVPDKLSVRVKLTRQ